MGFNFTQFSIDCRAGMVGKLWVLAGSSARELQIIASQEKFEKMFLKEKF